MVRHPHIFLKVPAVRRLFWLLVGIGHIPGLFDAWGSLATGSLEPGALGRCLGLTVTTIFMALKVRDVAFLRLREGRRTFVAACLVVALLHVNLVRRTSESSAMPDCSALAATVWVAGGLATVRRILATNFARVRTIEKNHVRASRFAETVWLDAVRPHCWLLALALFLLRAPPA